MKKIPKTYAFDPKVIDAVKKRAEKLSKKEDRKVSESEIVNKILKKALIK